MLSSGLEGVRLFSSSFPSIVQGDEGCAQTKADGIGMKKPLLESGLICAGSYKRCPSFQPLFPSLHRLDMNPAMKATFHR
jgi:hypothetical protein